MRADAFQDGGVAGLGAAQVPLPLKSAHRRKAKKAIESAHDHVLADLKKSGMDFVEKFTSTMFADPEASHEFEDGERFPWKFILDTRSSGDDEQTILHQIIPLVHDTKLDPGAARCFTEKVVQEDPELIADCDVEPPLNALELAVSYKNCQGIIEAICEQGMVQIATKPAGEKDAGEDKKRENLKTQESRVSQARAQRSKTPGVGIQQPNVPPSPMMPPARSSTGRLMANGQDDEEKTLIERNREIIIVRLKWEDLKESGRDSCLHMAIRDKKNDYAMYLLKRMHMTGEQESLLSHLGRDGLTPLHLAVEYKKCSNERVELVKYIIDIYPEALAVQSGTSPSDARGDNSGGRSQESRQGGPRRAARRPKEAVSPYKYFIDTSEVKNTRRGVQEEEEIEESTKKAAEKMKELLRLSCMRHHGGDRALITKLLDTQGQIHLDLNPRTEVTQQLLNYMAEMPFEPYLQYVYIPNLQVLNVMDDKLEAEQWWDSHSRKDYVYIFRWLKNTKNVQRILSIVVEDDPIHFHSDEAIEAAVRGFDIEVWNWVKLDMCSDTILAAAENVRDLSLYWSGNRAVLKSWAAEDGLARLEKLETIRIMTPESIESTTRTSKITQKFLTDLQKAWDTRWKGKKGYRGPPKVKIEPVTTQAHVAKKLSEKERLEKGRKEQWLRCTEDFAQTLKKYLNNRSADKKNPLRKDQYIKVAIIDDGVDADRDDIGRNIEAGETFYDNKGHWPGYYQSGYGHGHLMASLIRQLCPKVRLYIAKLNELWSDGKPQITAESAAKAVDWAREKDVDIISMSWTIEDPKDDAKTLLKNAIDNALQADILLFCASNDQGNQTGIPYPACINKEKIFRIGSATALGKPDEKTQKSVMFIVPGLDEVKQTAIREDLGFANPRSGSSIATARCAGLAALILQCVMLVYGSIPKREVRQHQKMQQMFMLMVDKDKDKDGDSKYLRVWDVFDVAKAKAELDKDEEWNVISTVARAFVNAVNLKWENLGQAGFQQPMTGGDLAQHTTAGRGLPDRSRQRMAAVDMSQKGVEEG